MWKARGVRQEDFSFTVFFLKGLADATGDCTQQPVALSFQPRIVNSQELISLATGQCSTCACMYACLVCVCVGGCLCECASLWLCLCERVFVSVWICVCCWELNLGLDKCSMTERQPHPCLFTLYFYSRISPCIISWPGTSHPLALGLPGGGP